MFESMADVVPAGSNGSARVEHVIVTEEAAKFSALRAAINPHRRERPIEAGSLCQLFINGTMMMSDAANEHSTNSYVVYKANGDVLIAGLGLGMILLPICKKPEVRSVTVLENNVDVMSLVSAPIREALGKDAEKLTIFWADAFKYTPHKEHTQKFDTVYFDIWPTITTASLPEITKLKRRYARRLRRDNQLAWMGAWCEQEIRYRKKQEARDQERYGGYSKLMGRCGTFR